MLNIDDCENYEYHSDFIPVDLNALDYPPRLFEDLTYPFELTCVKTGKEEEDQFLKELSMEKTTQLLEVPMPTLAIEGYKDVLEEVEIHQIKIEESSYIKNDSIGMDEYPDENELHIDSEVSVQSKISCRAYYTNKTQKSIKHRWNRNDDKMLFVTIKSLQDTGELSPDFIHNLSYDKSTFDPTELKYLAAIVNWQGPMSNLRQRIAFLVEK